VGNASSHKLEVGERRSIASHYTSTTGRVDTLTLTFDAFYRRVWCRASQQRNSSLLALSALSYNEPTNFIRQRTANSKGLSASKLPKNKAHPYWFLPRCMSCRRGIARRILSVRLSVLPSVCQTRDPWQNGRKICPDFYTIWKNIYPSFWKEEWLVGGDPFYLKFWVNRPPLERNRRFSTNNRS